MSNGMGSLDAARNMTQCAAKFIRITVSKDLGQVLDNRLLTVEVVSDVEGDEFVGHG